ncbi:MAG: hypothetical protein Tsb009_08540 [Planctomycetaceae bacterium]
MAIWILEDNFERTIAMRQVLRERYGIRTPPVFVAAQYFIENIEAELSQARLISLDHDLEMIEKHDGTFFDPGTGRDVADFLSSQKPVCPVIIHSTNVPAAVGMEVVLQEAGWETTRITPYDDIEWINDIWIETVQQYLGESVPETVQAWPYSTLKRAKEVEQIVEERVREVESGNKASIP